MANANPIRSRRRTIRTNTVITTVSTRTSRRRRNTIARQTSLQEPSNRAQQADSRRLGQRLNIILGPQAERNRIQPDGNTEFQPLFGSYAKLDNRDKWEDDIPIAAHAEYFRLQRYAERQEEVSWKWAALDNEVVAAYLLNQEKTRNWTHASCDFLVHPARCKCPSTLISQRKSVGQVNL
ncbi:hypothetical protein PtB15_2B753 [Puccinia triticina]|nr:hypothetical protein PtB15_2B753 [Puccinia triticina]